MQDHVWLSTYTLVGPCFNATYKALFGQVLFSGPFTEEDMRHRLHRLGEQKVGAQWTVVERTVQEQMVVHADLVKEARKMEAGHMVVLSVELP